MMVNEENRPWSDLHPDILGCFAERLSLVDQIRFRAVCKSWRQIRGMKSNEKFPWLFGFDNGLVLSESYPNAYYFLYDLSNRTSHRVTIRQESTKRRFHRFNDNSVECVKSNWLLLNPICQEDIFLFNAFSQEIIDLPTVPNVELRWVFTFKYAAEPRRFLVYAVNSLVIEAKKVSILRWSSGDREWEQSDFVPEFPGPSNDFIVDVECVGGILYCIFRSGIVGIFDKSWSLIEVASNLFRGFTSRGCTSRVFELRGELFVMVKSPGHGPKRWDVLRLDRSSRDWVKVSGLRSCAMFLSRIRRHSVMCREQSEGDSDSVCIYYCHYCFRGMFSEGLNDDMGDSQTLDRLRRHIAEIEFPWRRRRPAFTEYASEHWIEPPTI